MRDLVGQEFNGWGKLAICPTANAMTTETLWQDLIKIALLGTERQALALTSRADGLGAVLSHLAQREPPCALLAAAATVSLYRRAGQLPQQSAEVLPQRAADEVTPPCNDRAAQQLALMLNGAYAALLPEWLHALAAARQRVPPELLPQLLDLGCSESALQSAIGAALGERGHWLARHNPAWGYAVGDLHEADWQDGARNVRLSLLRQLRATKPQRARELVASTWQQDAPDDRAAFIAAFADGLTMADEPFLEAALDDRRKEVRVAAAQLLKQLPASRLCQRMTERVRVCLPWKAGKKSPFVVRLPEQCDKELQRDGVEAKAQRGFGEKAWWLAQMLGAVPPRVWCEAWRQTPSELIAVIRKHEWENVLLTGWAEAARNQRDAAWAEALLTLSWASDVLVGLMSVMSPPRVEAVIMELLPTQDVLLRSDHPALTLLVHYRQPWSSALTHAVITAVKRTLETGKFNYQTDWQLRTHLKDFARYVALSEFAALTTDWPTTAQSWEQWASVVEEFMAMAQFREEMRQALQR
jgi:hypothetical protein